MDVGVDVVCGVEIFRFEQVKILVVEQVTWKLLLHQYIIRGDVITGLYLLGAGKLHLPPVLNAVDVNQTELSNTLW